MIDLQFLDSNESLFFIDSETLLPAIVEILHMLVANLHILAHLLVLDVRTELLLIANDLLLQSARFFHQVFV